MKRVEIGHTSSVMVFNKDGQILLSKRKAKEGEGMYGFPGGKSEKGEKPIKAAKRELEEEIGIKATQLKKIDKRKIRLSKIWSITLFYLLVNETMEKKIKNVEPEKTESLDWFDLDNLPENMWSHNKQYLLENLEKIKKLNTR